MIKNIIFDLGDVFINLDKSVTAKELEKLGVHIISDEMLTMHHQYERGIISTATFLAFYQLKFPFVKKKDLINAWNAILLDFPKKRLSFLQELSKTKKYRLFLLSNTNELHINWIKDNLSLPFYNSFKNCFEQFYLSHEMFLRKPTLAVYEFVLKEHNLIAGETLFIDDTEENTRAAKKLGMLVWNLIPKQEDVVDLQNRKEFLF